MFDFGESFFPRSVDVVDLVLEKMPVSISLGIWTTLLVYLISIPLGVAKAVRDGRSLRYLDVRFSSSSVSYAIPEIPLRRDSSWSCSPAAAIFDWFPLRGLHLGRIRGVSIFAGCATSLACIADYLWHLTAARHRHGDRRLRHPQPC